MTDTTAAPAHWWDDPENVAELAHWLANERFTAKDVAYAVEKPWKWEAEYRACVLERRREEAAAEAVYSGNPERQDTVMAVRAKVRANTMKEGDHA